MNLKKIELLQLIEITIFCVGVSDFSGDKFFSWCVFWVLQLLFFDLLE